MVSSDGLPAAGSLQPWHRLRRQAHLKTTSRNQKASTEAHPPLRPSVAADHPGEGCRSSKQFKVRLVREQKKKRGPCHGAACPEADPGDGYCRAMSAAAVTGGTDAAWSRTLLRRPASGGRALNGTAGGGASLARFRRSAGIITSGIYHSSQKKWRDCQGLSGSEKCRPAASFPAPGPS